MKIIALVTQKGGAGKTTLAASLAVVAQADGEKVIALDADPQGSLANWYEDRDNEEPPVERVDGTTLMKLDAILKALAGKGYTLAIIDTAGIDSTGTHLAMQHADLCLLPSRPTRLDVRATKATYEAAIRMSKQFFFVLNQCPPQPNNPRAAETANGLSMLGIVAQPLVIQRADHQDAFASGQGVSEYAPNSKAADEMRQLWRWISNKMKDHSYEQKAKAVNS